jgi:uncharacterized membrane protein
MDMNTHKTAIIMLLLMPVNVSQKSVNHPLVAIPLGSVEGAAWWLTSSPFAAMEWILVKGPGWSTFPAV